MSTYKKFLRETDVEKELDELGLKLISYISFQEVYYECTCGNMHKSQLGHIQRGHKCGKCIEFKHRALIQSKDCMVIKYHYSTKIDVLCHCNKVFTTSIYQFNGLCPNCKAAKRPPKSTRRGALGPWKKAVFKLYGRCQKCGSFDLPEIHHIEAYSLRPDLASDIENGIVLCNYCHTTLHSNFGIRTTRIDLNKFLTKSVGLS